MRVDGPISSRDWPKSSTEPTFSTNIISRAEEDRFEPEYELAEEARLRVLEDLHPFQGVEVHVDGYLSFQFIWNIGFVNLFKSWCLT